MHRIVYWLILLAIFTVPFEDFAEFSGFSISKAVGLILAFFWLVKVLIKGEFRRPRPFHAVVFLLVLWIAISSVWSSNPTETARQFTTYIQLFGLVYIVWDTITTMSGLRAALQAYVLGALVAASSLLRDYLVEGAVGYQIRFSTGMSHINDFGLILGLAIPAAWYLVLQGKEHASIRRLRWVNTVYIPVAVVAVLLTGSRSGAIAVLPGLIYVLVSLRRLRVSSRVLALALVVGLFLTLLPLVPDATFQRVSSPSAGISGRVETWREAYAAFRSNPVLGVGSAAFLTQESGRSPHNFVLRFLAELGLIGFGLFSLVLLILATSARHQPERALVGLWVSVLIVWVIGASVHNFEAEKQTWVFFSLIVVASSLPTRAGSIGPQRPGSSSPFVNPIGDVPDHA